MWRAALALTIALMGSGAPASVKTDMNPRVKTALRLSILTLIAYAILFYLPGF